MEHCVSDRIAFRLTSTAKFVRRAGVTSVEQRVQEPSQDLESRVARLSAGQRECLARVTDHATSKEIARELGISPHTVDARMRAALQTLGVSSRREAAIVFRAALSANEYQPTAYQASHLAAGDADTPDGGYDEPAAPGDDRDEDPDGVPAAPAHRAFDAAFAGPANDWRGPVPQSVADGAAWSAVAFTPAVAPAPQFRLWGGVNDLTPVQRMVAVFIVMIVSMLAFGMLLAGMEALSALRR
jgi:DNA-binding CsgD family transcriptional regulator